MPKYDILIFWAEWLEMVRWQVNYGTSLVYRESTDTDCNEMKL